MEVVDISLHNYEFVKRTWAGNVYRKRWFVTVADDRESPYGEFMQVNGKDVPVRTAFIGTKKEVKDWLVAHNLSYPGW